MNPLPTFLVIGAQKSGTTSLYRYLRDHPEVQLSRWKEPGFFVEEQTWDRGLDWYRSLFEGGEDAIAVGEASTSYTMFPFFAGVPERIATTLPDVRLVYLLRDPVDRMRSSYVHSLSSGIEHRPIRQALLESAVYASISRYALQLEQYLDHVDPARILVVTTAALEQQPAETLDRIFSFIGVRSWTPPGLDVHHHRSAAKRVPRVWSRVAGRAGVRAAQITGIRLDKPPKPPKNKWFTRHLRPEETRIDDDLRRRLQLVLADDVARLQALVGGDGPELVGELPFPGWDGAGPSSS